MKINITKLQAGGYINYQPISTAPTPQQPAPAQQAPQQGDDVESYMDPSIMRRMLGKGITTDVMQYSQQLQSAYQQYQYMNDFQKNSYQGRQIRMMLKGDLGQLNALVRAKDDFDNSIQDAKTNDALDETAVTGQGMIVRDNQSGKITQVGFGQYAQNKDKYTALTNAQLAEQREYNTALTGNNAISSVLSFGRGMPKIQEEIYKIVNTIGNSKQTTATGSYDTGDAQNVQDLVQAAKAGAFKIKSGSSTDTNVPQIQAAQQALWMNLSDGSKAVLRARAAQLTTNPGDIDKLAYKMMSSLLDPHVTTSQSTTFDESAMKGPNGAKGAAPKLANWGSYGMAFSGANNTIPLSQIGPQGARIDGFASAIPTSAYTGKNDERVPLANAAKLNNISYISQAFTGNGDKVDPNLTSITGDAYVTELPYTQDADGNYKIDADGAKKFAQYEQAKKNTQLSPQEDFALREKFGIQNFKTKKFVVAEASTIDKDYFTDRDKNYYDPVTGADRDALQKIVDPDHTTNHMLSNNSAHKMLIYIPAKQLASWNALDGNDAKIPEQSYEITKGYNRGNDGTGQGTTYEPQQQVYSTSYLDNK
jgi:hypothetical protein